MVSLLYRWPLHGDEFKESVKVMSQMQIMQTGLKIGTNTMIGMEIATSQVFVLK